MYKNILVGYDGSEHSAAALVEALHWAKAHGGKVDISHAVFFDSEEFSISPGQLDKRLEAGKELCMKAKERYSSELGVDIECQVMQGEPHETIPRKALDEGMDLIALGTYGRRGIRRMIMGSVTSGVILDSPCDVLVVRKPCEQCTGKYTSILAPYDGSESAKRAVERAAELASSESASLTVLYVIPRYEEIVGFIKTDAIRENLFQEARKIVLEGEQIAQGRGVSVNTMVEEGHSFEKITALANGIGCDLIVMGSHGWRGLDKAILGSTTERVIAHSSVPVLVVR